MLARLHSRRVVRGKVPRDLNFGCVSGNGVAHGRSLALTREGASACYMLHRVSRHVNAAADAYFKGSGGGISLSNGSFGPAAAGGRVKYYERAALSLKFATCQPNVDDSRWIAERCCMSRLSRSEPAVLSPSRKLVLRESPARADPRLTAGRQSRGSPGARSSSSTAVRSTGADDAAPITRLRRRGASIVQPTLE